MIRWTYMVLILCFSSVLSASAYSFHEVAPETGEGIYALLRRYMLIEDRCNLEKFCELNNVSEKDELLSEKKYKLPVAIYNYNGRSIRSTIGVNDWDMAVEIKEYNEKILKEGLRTSHYTDSKILWVPYHYLNCKETSNNIATTSPTKAKKNSVSYFPVFGKKYGKIEIADHSLKNKVYYIVSGHGGPDPGAMCTECSNELCEDEYAYDVAARLARNLMQHGATVHLIVQDKNDGIRDDKILKCDIDERCEGEKLPLNQKERLWQRTAAINKLYKKHKSRGVKSQEAVFIHVDSRSAKKRQDVFFYHYRHSKSGKILADRMQETFQKKYKKYQKGRGYKGYVEGKGLYVLRNALPTSLFVELANIRNQSDHRRLLNPSNRQALANWMFEGLIAN